ncbi:hypothetical protein BACCIP111899_03593 [Bacillus rhizoplanae]|uniref:Uncharacterized protein n=1 Tax=Bacillus rhizoplanae TaxID=2880966 RepID=A0ABM8YEY4_9BACI|nr:hypothetical protein [Bacillus rhizoplanae]CAG9614366.1 hypothetical protein BACCIP111899_03593 [Bacillus rhizoplanae]
MNKNYIWIALIISFLVVAPFNWFLPNTSLFLVIIRMLTKLFLYFFGILLTLNLLQYLKNRTNHEKQIIKLLEEIKNSIGHKEK